MDIPYSYVILNLLLYVGYFGDQVKNVAESAKETSHSKEHC